MNKWIAEFELEDGDTMPEHMDLEYNGAKIDFHCRPMWVPCSERLPENGGTVLVTDWGETDVGRRFDGRWLDCDGNKLKDVSAWMPLPEPYEDGEQDG